MVKMGNWSPQPFENDFWANDIALSYVIYPNSVPNHNNQLMRYEKSGLAAPHTGIKYNLDALAVHNIITRNIS